MAAKLRIVADLGVSDMQECLQDFLGPVLKQRSNFDLLAFVSPPPGVGWKTSCCCSWVVSMAPLLLLFLAKAPNGVLPGLKVRSALSALNQSSKLNHSKKTDKDWADLIDEGIRMCLSHLRSLTDEEKKSRAFRKVDVRNQEVLQDLLQKLRVPETEAGATDPASETAVVPVSTGSPVAPAGRGSSLASLGSPVDLSPGHSDMDLDPGAVFARILQGNSPEQEAEGEVLVKPSAVKSPEKRKPGRLDVHSPDKGFLPGLRELTQDDRDMLAQCQKQEAPSKPCKKPKGKTKAKTKGKLMDPAAASAESPAGHIGKPTKKPATVKEKPAESASKPCGKETAKRKDALPDEQVDRTTRRKRVVSRAYHRACDAALAAGKDKVTGKKLGRDAAQKAGQEFDEQNPRPAARKADTAKEDEHLDCGEAAASDAVEPAVKIKKKKKILKKKGAKEGMDGCRAE